MPLQKLPEKDAVLRDAMLRLIGEQAWFIELDFGCKFTLHEIKGRHEMALQADDVAADDYQRIYAVQNDPDSQVGSHRLVIDNMIFDTDEVDLKNQLFYDEVNRRWDLTPKVRSNPSS